MILKEAQVDQVVLLDFSADYPDFWVKFYLLLQQVLLFNDFLIICMYV